MATEAQLYDPNAIAKNASEVGQSAFGEANEINTLNNQEAANIAGTVKAAAGAAAGGFGNLDTTGGSTGGEQVGNFLQGFAG